MQMRLSVLLLIIVALSAANHARVYPDTIELLVEVESGAPIEVQVAVSEGHCMAPSTVTIQSGHTALVPVQYGQHSAALRISAKGYETQFATVFLDEQHHGSARVKLERERPSAALTE